MADSLKYVPPDNEEHLEPDKREDPKRSRLSVSLGPFKLEAVGKFLEQRFAVLGIAFILGSIVAVLYLLGDKVGRLFK